MDAHVEKDRSSKRTREDRDRRDRHRERERDRDHKHRSHDDDDRRHRDSDRHHYHRSDKDSKREHSNKSRRERSRELSYDSRDELEGSRDGVYDRDGKRERPHEPGGERAGSRERPQHRAVKREESYEERDSDLEFRSEREESVDRGHPSYSHKRKEREHNEDKDRDDREEKRTRVLEESKERRIFEDKVEDGKELNGRGRERRRERRKFGDKVKKEEDLEDNEDGKQVKVKFGNKVKKEEVLQDNENGNQVKVNDVRVKEEPNDQKFDNAQGSANGNASVGSGFTLGSHASTSRIVPEASLVPSPSPTIKVSLISTTHENKGVSITGSHEVTGKSSTDGSSSTTGKSGNISLDALAKAKKALQMKKELSEKLKKISQLNKSSTKVEGSTQLGLQDESKMPSVSAGVAAMTATPASAGRVADISNFPAAAAAAQPPTVTSADPAIVGAVPNYEAVRRAQELAARMGFRQDPQFAPLINMFPGQMVTDIAAPQKPTKAPVLRLDAQGREIDEHGNVVNVTKPSNLSTLKVNINKQKKDSFQILKPVLDVDPESNPHFDDRMGINKTKLLRPKRMTFQFVEEGKWSKEAETIKLKSKFGEAQAKEHKAKQAQLAKAKAAPDINPNLIEITERVVIKEKPKEQIPEIEWW